MVTISDIDSTEVSCELAIFANLRTSVIIVAFEGFLRCDFDAEDIFEARALLDDLGVVVGGAARVDHLDEDADGGGGEVGQGEAEVSL